ncbi:hypothetical protein SAY86_005650 [Trapa natans]|uniref:DUF4378 domain-containing protein n=1 Tax=Trapa natans TaxID=22666 RepID=A0AAN7L9M6_TRANT|nr:hypothetical protein SAY86_005650 [Trapa natans]
MANLFDVTAGLAKNKLLIDKRHCDGSHVTRSLSDVSVMVEPSNMDQTMSDSRRSSCKKSNVTSIKMLIAQEMSKEIDFKKSSPNLVAKLMGLDALSIHLPNSITERSQTKSYLQQRRSLNHSRRRVEYSHHGRSLSDDQMQLRFHEYQEHGNYKDVYNVLQQSEMGTFEKKKSLGKERNSDALREKKMALVREKFLEAKCLAPDAKLRHSKEFKDAVEVLSSNRDLFLKILQEPNSLFSKHIHQYHSIPSPPQSKCITILKPSKMIYDDKNSKYLTKKLAHVSPGGTGWDQCLPGYSSPYGCPTQPTRIVVLKPSHGKSCDVKSVVPILSSSAEMLQAECFSEKVDDIEETREVTKEITRQMCENLVAHRRDEPLISSVFSNGYIGDDSSFNRSGNDYLDGSLSDSEVVTPTSRHYWDFIDRSGSQYAASSFSHASHSPESSVCREAKKRISERWALIASKQNCLEQRHSRKITSTLGEMLVLSDRKNWVTLEKNRDSSRFQESVEPISLPTNSVNKEAPRADSPKSLSMSESLPLSSSVYGNQLIVQVLEPEIAKPEEHTKRDPGKSSPKWRVSNLFCSMSRKSSKDKDSQLKDVSQPGSAETFCSSEYSPEKMDSFGTDVPTGNLSEANEQPSPISVLDQSFLDEKTTPESWGKQASSSQMFKSNLIDKSPLIGSLVRTLSWDAPHAENASPCTLRSGTACLNRAEEEEDENDWLCFIQNLLSAADIEGKDPSDSSTSTWYSRENSSLRDKIMALDERCPLPKTMPRQMRSYRKLALDFVSSVIIEMMGIGGVHKGPISAEQVWAQMKWWFMKEAREKEDGGGGSRDSLLVEKVMRYEMVGRWWVDNMRVEVESIGQEVEGKLLQELVDEAVGDMSGTT